MNVPGLGRLVEEYNGKPATLRWLLIHPDGRLVERVSDNTIAWWAEHAMWVQWRLVRDVFREVAPTGQGIDLTGAVSIRTAQCTSITARSDTGLVNPVATGMLGRLGIEREVHGPMAWLADAHPDTGLHGDLEDDERAALVERAVECGATLDGAS